MIDVADIVFFLPDWQKSPGARLEHMYCDYINKVTLELYKMPQYQEVIAKEEE